MDQGKPSILGPPKALPLIDNKFDKLPIRRISPAQMEERKKKKKDYVIIVMRNGVLGISAKMLCCFFWIVWSLCQIMVQG